MHTIHCHFCGGIVPGRVTIDYRPPRSSAQVALPQPGTCTCTPPIVYEDSPLDHPSRDVERVEPIERVQKVQHVERRERAAPALPPDPSDPWKGAA